MFARQAGEPIEYTMIDSPPNAFADSVARFVAAGGRGLNVTLPFKQLARGLAAEVSEPVAQTGAANTLCFRDDGSVYADNTDGVGLCNDLRRLGVNLNGGRLLVIGAGGACRGILWALFQAGVRDIALSNRDLERAAQIVEEFASYPLRVCDNAELANSKFDGVINATSASLSGAVPYLPATLARSLAWGYDLVYAHGGTPFTKWLQEQGVESAYDGIGMLVEQAAASFYLWHGYRPAGYKRLTGFLKGSRGKVP